jgi:hypothetical protein
MILHPAALSGWGDPSAVMGAQRSGFLEICSRSLLVPFGIVIVVLYSCLRKNVLGMWLLRVMPVQFQQISQAYLPTLSLKVTESKSHGQIRGEHAEA